MREIKFRGKHINTNEWAYGLMYYITKIDSYYIGEYHAEKPVITETIGQYTGLKDKNGKEIYEGDVVRIYDGSKKKDTWLFEIFWNLEKCCFSAKCLNDKNLPIFYTSKTVEYLIVGNIHDNYEYFKHNLKTN